MKMEVESEAPPPQAPPTKPDIATLPVAITAPELLFANATEKKLYWDRCHYDSPDSQILALAKSKTLYIGNLAFSTTSQHLLSLFSSAGHIERIVLGLDRYKKSPCGFAFVEYTDRVSALQAVICLSGSKLDGRPIRVELDAGFKPGRQYGRGISGGQVRDDRRTNVDPARRSNNNASLNNKWGGRQDQEEGSQNIDLGKHEREEETMDESMMDQPSAKKQRFEDEVSDEAMQ